MRLAIIQPPIWGNLRTPWEIAYIKSFVEGCSPHEVRTFDMGPGTLPFVEEFGQDIRRLVDNAFATECYLSSLAFITSIAETYLIRLFYDLQDEACRRAMKALLKTKTHHRGDSLERLTDTFLENPFFRTLDRKMEDLCVHIADEGYEYVGVTTHITSYPIALFLLRMVKRLRPDVITVLSGYQATIVPHETLKACPWVDIVIRGESEGGYLTLLSNQVRERQVLDQYTQPLQMDEMPPPDYRDLDMSQYKMVSIMASRNCPHGKCEFCQEDAFWSTFRFRSPANLVYDMEMQYERHGAKRFDFVDLDMRDFVVDLCRILEERGHDFKWSGAMRADARTPDILRRTGATNCKSIFFGFESGSPRLLKLMRKNITPKTLEETIRVANDVGFRSKLTCIAGLPTETPEEFQSTLDFVRRNADYIRLVLVQCFKVLTRSPIGTVMTIPSNAYGLKPYPIPELNRIQSLLYSMHYEGEPSPEVAVERFIEARRVFRSLGVDERATLLSTNKQHEKHLLGIR